MKYIKINNTVIKGFTLVELMIVVIIVGIIAGFSIPAFQKSTSKGQLRQVRANLFAISAANEVYKARNGNYWPTTVGSTVPAGQTGTGGLTQINAALGVSLVSTDANVGYSCTRTAPTTYSCQGGIPNGRYPFSIMVTDAAAPTCNPITDFCDS